MTDVHSHILFGIDDGSSSILESLELISKMKRAGFDKIIYKILKDKFFI